MTILIMSILNVKFQINYVVELVIMDVMEQLQALVLEVNATAILDIQESFATAILDIQENFVNMNPPPFNQKQQQLIFVVLVLVRMDVPANLQASVIAEHVFAI